MTSTCAWRRAADVRLLPCGRYAAAGAHVAESAPVYALATRAAGEVEGVVTTRTHPWRQSSNSQTRWCSSSWAAGGLGFGVATVASCGLAAAEAQAEVVSEPREVPGALSNEHTAKWRLFTDEGRKRAAKGLYADAIKYMNRALQEAKEGFGERDSHVAAALNNVAEIHRLQRQYSTAEPLYHQALEILIDTLGTSHPSTAAAMHNLGGFYLLQRDVDQAKQYYEKALACKEAALGRNHPEYATTLFHLAEALKLEGRRQDSLALLKQSLDILENAGMAETIPGQRRMGRLALALSELGSYAEAEAVLRRLLQMVENTRGATSMETATALENLAGSLEGQAKWSEARAVLRQALDMRRSLISPRPDSPQIGRTLRLLAAVELRCAVLTKEDGVTPAAQTALQNALQNAQVAVHLANRELQRVRDTAQRSARDGAAAVASPALMTPLVAATMEFAAAQRVAAAAFTQLRDIDTHGRKDEELLRDAVAALTEELVAARFGSSRPVREELRACLLQLAEVLSSREDDDGKEAAALREQAAALLILPI